MHANDYRLIAESGLRNVLRNVCNDPRDLPGRKALRAQLEEALPQAEADVIDALMTKCEEYAKEAVDPGNRWDLRAKADQLCLHVLKTYEAADRLVPQEDVEPADVSGTLQAIDDWNPAEKNARLASEAAKQAELRANLARQQAGN
jgi:hypothetical protein